MWKIIQIQALSYIHIIHRYNMFPMWSRLGEEEKKKEMIVSE
jgi:hypothetical protein